MRSLALAILFFGSNVLADDMSTVHEVTAEERRELGDCSSANAVARITREGAARMPKSAQEIANARVAEADRRAAECNAQLDAKVEKLRTEGTREEHLRREWEAGQPAREEEAKRQREELAKRQKVLDDAEAVRVDRYKRIRADPTAQRTAFSAFLCAWTADEKEALRQVHEYRAASRIGGVLNMTEVNNWQEEVVRARRYIAQATTELARRKAKPMECKHPAVARVMPCMTDDGHTDDMCGPDTEAYVDAARGNE